MNEKIKRVLKKIEEKEQDWEYLLSDTESKIHSFGRDPYQGNKINFWSVSRNIGELLRFFVLLTKPKTILELGCSAGYSTLWLASGLDSKGKIYTTEILDEKIRIAQTNFKEAGVEKNIKILKGNILQTIKQLKTKKIDFVFMDADKKESLKYYNLIFPLLKKGGVIISDNVSDYEYLMKDFLNKINKDKRIEHKYINMDGGLLIIYKK